MTPEQENELVARWMGYKLLSTREGTMHWIPPQAPDDPWIATYPIRPPRYRTDPALLWELMERLLKSEWSFETSSSGFWSAFVNTDELGVGHYRSTLAEAVFAAAVMQAQEGK